MQRVRFQFSFSQSSVAVCVCTSFAFTCHTFRTSHCFIPLAILISRLMLDLSLSVFSPSLLLYLCLTHSLTHFELSVIVVCTHWFRIYRCRHFKTCGRCIYIFTTHIFSMFESMVILKYVNVCAARTCCLAMCIIS